MTTTSRLITGPLLFLTLILSGCGAPPEEEPEPGAEQTEQEEAGLRTCIKGQPCNDPLLPPPPKKVQRTYCCDYGVTHTIRSDSKGNQYVHEIKGYGCRNLSESKNKSCRLDIQVTCSGFQIETLAGGELTCAAPR